MTHSSEIIEDPLLEKMAEAQWNVHATIPWAEFMPSRPEVRQWHLRAMKAAYDLLMDEL